LVQAQKGLKTVKMQFFYFEAPTQFRFCNLQLLFLWILLSDNSRCMISGARSIISARAFINEMVQSEQQQHTNGNNCMTGTFVLLQRGI
jgi:hypothetical protein